MLWTLAEGTEDEVGKGIEPTVEMYHTAVDNAGVADMDGEVVAMAAVQLFGKEHYCHLAVGIGFHLAVVGGVGLEEIAVEAGNIAGERDCAHHMGSRVHQGQKPTGEVVGAEVVGGQSAFIPFGCGLVFAKHGAGIVEETVLCQSVPSNYLIILMDRHLLICFVKKTRLLWRFNKIYWLKCA